MINWKNSNFNEKMSMGHGWSETGTDSDGTAVFRWFWNNSTSESILEDVTSGKRFVISDGSSTAKRLAETIHRNRSKLSTSFCCSCKSFQKSFTKSW